MKSIYVATIIIHFFWNAFSIPTYFDFTITTIACENFQLFAPSETHHHDSTNQSLHEFLSILEGQNERDSTIKSSENELPEVLYIKQNDTIELLPNIPINEKRSTEIFMVAPLDVRPSGMNQLLRSPGIYYQQNEPNRLSIVINPDFLMDDVDIFQLNLNRFELYYSERRKFFRQDMGLFDFGFDGNMKLFYSRRLGISHLGRQSRTFGTLKYVNSSEKFDFGILSALYDDMTTGSLTSANVVRLKRRFSKSGPIAGIILTASNQENEMQFNMGTDLLFPWGKDQQVEFKWAQSFANTPGNGSFAPFNNGHLFIRLKNNPSYGLIYETKYSRVGSRFNPDLGFQFVRNYTMLNQTVKFRVRKNKINSSNTYAIFASGNMIFAEHRPYAEMWSINSGLELSLSASSALRGQVTKTQNLQSTSFRMMDEIDIPTNNYSNCRATLDYRYASNGISLQTTAEAGSLFHGTHNRLVLELSKEFSPGVSVSGKWDSNMFKYRSDGVRMVNIYWLKMTSAISKLILLQSTIQYTNLGQNYGINLRLKYSILNQHSLALVYNRNTFLHSEKNSETTFNLNRASLFLKYTYHFSIVKKK